MVEVMEEFAGRWKSRAEELKRHSLGRDQCNRIMLGFFEEFRCAAFMSGDDYDGYLMPLFFEIFNDLNIALEIANSRKKSFWGFLKPKDTSVVKIGNEQ